MARGLLISYAGYPLTVSSLFPDNGLACLAAVLLEAGHEVKVLDFNTVTTAAKLYRPARSRALSSLLGRMKEEGLAPDVVESILEVDQGFQKDLESLAVDLLERISLEVQRQGSDFVGFKLWSGDGLAATSVVAKGLKQRFPGLKVFGGGPAVLYARQGVFRLCPEFDALVDGEAEASILGLAEYSVGRCSLSYVPNLIVRDGEAVRRTRREFVADLEALPLPVYDAEVYPSLAGDEHVKVFVLDESRGCPMGCAFCVHQGASGARWRLKSGKRVVREMERIMEAGGKRCFRFGGSFTPPRFFDDLWSEMGCGNSDMVLCGFSHPSVMSDQVVRKLADLGFQSLFLGVESFHPADSKGLGKKVDPVAAEHGTRLLMEAGIVPVISLIVPVPGQDAEGYRVNLETSAGLCGNREASVVTQFPGLIPRTGWWRDRDGFGFRLLVDEDDYNDFLAALRIRHIVPPVLWQPAPYLMDGMGFKDFAGINAEFQSELTKRGVVVNVADEMAALARVLGEDLSSFRQRMQRLFFVMDAHELAGFAEEVNQRLSESV